MALIYIIITPLNLTIVQCRRCSTLSRKDAVNKARNKVIANNNVQFFQDIRARLHKEAAKVSALSSNVESVRNLRQERLAADTRASVAETRAENLRLQRKATDRKLQQALRRYVHLGNGKYLG